MDMPVTERPADKCAFHKMKWPLFKHLARSILVKVRVRTRDRVKVRVMD